MVLIAQTATQPSTGGFLDILRTGAGVTTGIGLLGFIVAALFLWQIVKVRSRVKMLGQVREAERGKLIDDYLTRYGIDAGNLTREQKFELIRDEMRHRSVKAGRFASLGAATFVVCFALAMWPSKHPDVPLPPPRPQTLRVTVSGVSSNASEAAILTNKAFVSKDGETGIASFETPVRQWLQQWAADFAPRMADPMSVSVTVVGTGADRTVQPSPKQGGADRWHVWTFRDGSRKTHFVLEDDFKPFQGMGDEVLKSVHCIFARPGYRPVDIRVPADATPLTPPLKGAAPWRGYQVVVKESAEPGLQQSFEGWAQAAGFSVAKPGMLEDLQRYFKDSTTSNENEKISHVSGAWVDFVITVSLEK